MFWLKTPLSVPPAKRALFHRNWQLATRRSGRLFLLAGDQKIEHLNHDFYGDGIDPADARPEHLFQIAAASPIGVLATDLGLISQYGHRYRQVPYLVKLNGKTDLIPVSQQDPQSGLLASVENVVAFKKYSDLKIVGVGYTLYPGAATESQMLSQAAQAVSEAHRHGLLAVLWIYARGRAVSKSLDPHLAAGLAGLAACLDADFVKLSQPTGLNPVRYSEIMAAAGQTGVIFSGGESINPKQFLTTLARHIKNGARGNATGRNIHQKSLSEAIRFCQAIAAVSLQQKSVAAAYDIYLGKRKN